MLVRRPRPPHQLFQLLRKLQNIWSRITRIIANHVLWRLPFSSGSRFWPWLFTGRFLSSSFFSSAYSVPPCFKGFAVLRASAVKPLILFFSVSLCLRGRC